MSAPAGASGVVEDPAPSRSHTLVIEAIDAAKREAREQAAVHIKEIEARLHAEIAKLDRAAAAMNGNDEAERGGQQRVVAAQRKPKRRRLKRASTSAAAVAKRCEDVFRFIGESPEPVASGEIGRALGMSSHSVHTTLGRLLNEGRIARVGAHAATKYTLKRGLDGLGGRPPGSRTSMSNGTLQGRIVETIEDRSSATAEELAQALGVPLDRIIDACGVLQAEGEIHMNSRNGRPVYVIQVRVA